MDRHNDEWELLLEVSKRELAAEKAKSERLLSALKKYKNMSCSVQNIDMAARDAIAAYEKSQAGGGGNNV